jgi:hypothetical protein
MISIKKCLVLAATVVLGLVMFIPITQAEQPFDYTVCASGTITILSTSEEMNVFSTESKGITISNHENKLFHNCTYQFMGVGRGPTGKPIGYGYFKLMDSDGDFVIGELSGLPTDLTLKFLQGTGKWKGITGSGKGQRLASGKPIVPGTVQFCTRYTGTFELKK